MHPFYKSWDVCKKKKWKKQHHGDQGKQQQCQEKLWRSFKEGYLVKHFTEICSNHQLKVKESGMPPNLPRHGRPYQLRNGPDNGQKAKTHLNKNNNYYSCNSQMCFVSNGRLTRKSLFLKKTMNQISTGLLSDGSKNCNFICHMQNTLSGTTIAHHLEYTILTMTSLCCDDDRELGQSWQEDQWS